ncbi:MAG TPA: DUF1015 domain-containing protein [Kofleriaceae bacterium]|nr:DUF1015 domain-containing protein [Kofleriaceae bacterium]
MADIAPFRGIVYDPKRVEISKVIAPPYDVIDPPMRAKLAADPHNVVEIDLPEVKEGDKYAHAAATFDRWLAEGILRQDASKSIYRYHQRFTSAELGGRAVVRKGFVCAIRLTPFGEGTVRPHERTLKGPKEDRFKLITAARAHFSQVFGLFSDASGEVERLFRKYESAAPTLQGTTSDGTEHVVWAIRDAEMIGRLRRLMSPKHIYIADGHHRYETMLAVRDAIAGGKEPSMYSSLNYGSIFLASMDDPGLIVLPTHRIVHGLTGFSKDTLLERAREWFIVDKIAGGASDMDKVRASVADAVAHRTAFAALFPKDPDAWRFTLSPSVNPAAVGLSGHPAVLRLDVTLLHGLLLERVLGITPAAQEAQTNLRYVKDSTAALAATSAPDTQAVFLMGAPKVADVKHVADAGEIMPQKSTYFYPKIASGLVMAKVDPDEDLV